MRESVCERERVRERACVRESVFEREKENEKGKGKAPAAHAVLFSSANGLQLFNLYDLHYRVH